MGLAAVCPRLGSGDARKASCGLLSGWELEAGGPHQKPVPKTGFHPSGGWVLAAELGAWLLTKAVCPGLGFGEANKTICGLFSGWELEAGDSGHEETTGLRAGGCVLAADQEAWLLTGGPS